MQAGLKETVSPPAGGLKVSGGDPILRLPRGASGGGGRAVGGAGRPGSRAVIFIEALSAGLRVLARCRSPWSFRKCLPWCARANRTKLYTEVRPSWGPSLHFLGLQPGGSRQPSKTTL